MKFRIVAAIAVVTAAAVLPAWAQAKPAPPKAKKDKVILANGSEWEGEIKTDTWKEVIIDVGNGKTERALADDVVYVEYKDAPDAFIGAVERIKENDYKNGLASLNSADEWIQEQTKKDKKFTIRGWFKPYFLYWRSVCFAGMEGKEDQAIRDVTAYFKEGAANSRFIRPAISVAFQVFRKTKDVKGAETFMSGAAVPGELQAAAKMELGELMLAAGEADKALGISQGLETDPKYGTQALVLTIKCMSKQGNAQALEAKAKAIMGTSPDMAAQFIAKLALATIRFEAKQFMPTIDLLSEALVKNFARGLDNEREDALFKLARSYEEYGAGLKSNDAKLRFLVMANRTYGELALLYRNGKYKAEADAKAEELDKKIEVLEKGAKKEEK